VHCINSFCIGRKPDNLKISLRFFSNIGETKSEKMEKSEELFADGDEAAPERVFLSISK
jgi:hypothetical protein